MTNHNSTLDSGLRVAAIALTLTGAAFAGGPSAGTIAFNTADANTNGSLDLPEFTTTLAEGTTAPKAARAFKKADTDKGGTISLNEYLIYIGEIEAPTKEELSFDAADVSNDNSISFAEFEDTFTGKTAPIEIFKRFLKADSAAPAGLSLEEWTLYKKGKAKGPEGEKYYKFDLADALGVENNELSLDEFALTFPQGTKPETIAAKFAKEDEDDNNVLTRDEWNPGAPKQSAAL